MLQHSIWIHLYDNKPKDPTKPNDNDNDPTNDNDNGPTNDNDNDPTNWINSIAAINHNLLSENVNLTASVNDRATDCTWELLKELQLKIWLATIWTLYTHKM